MDDLDYTALRLLVKQGRITWAELAQHLKLSSITASAQQKAKATKRSRSARNWVTGRGFVVARGATAPPLETLAIARTSRGQDT